MLGQRYFERGSNGHFPLFFADDSLLMIKADDANAHVVQEILNEYETCSDQTI